MALLAAMEGVLRAAHYGRSTRPFIEKQCDGKTVYFRNKAFVEQFFSESIRGQWEEPEFEVLAEKPADTVRIFVFGSSAAMGWPAYRFAFPHLLEVMLTVAYPQTHFEVYNAAYWGLNSHAMRVMARACAKLKPDLFLVYMGNNEIHGPFGLRSGFRSTAGPPSLTAIRAKIWLGDLRLVQLMRGVPGTPPKPTPDAVSLPDARPDDPRLNNIYENFQKNLEDICDAGTGAGARVILSTVGANLRHWPPAADMHLHPLSASQLSDWDNAFKKGAALQDAGSYPDAAQAYRQAETIDDTHAGLAFRLGQCCWELGDYENARAHFTRALDLDTFDWVRAKTPINDAIARVAAKKGPNGVALVDAVRALADASPHGIPGVDRFIDSCHLNLDGSYVLACAMFDEIVRNLPEAVRRQGPEKPVPASLEECKLARALTPEMIITPLRLVIDGSLRLGREPTDELKRQLAELERQCRPQSPGGDMEALGKAVQHPARDYVVLCDYVNGLMSQNNLNAALDKARELAVAFPYRRVTHRILGQILADMGRREEAVKEFDKAVALFPDDAGTHARRGAALHILGRFEEALQAYEEALKCDPNESLAKCGKGDILARKGRMEAARQCYREVLDLNPLDWSAYEKMYTSFSGDENPEGLLAEFRRLADKYLRSSTAHVFLGMALEKAKNTDEAIDAFRKARELDPGLPPARNSLAAALCAKARTKQQQGRLNGALALFREAKTVNPEYEQAKAGEQEVLGLIGANPPGPGS